MEVVERYNTAVSKWLDSIMSTDHDCRQSTHGYCDTCDKIAMIRRTIYA